VAEELRFFLRTALYVAAVAVVYWLVSYEPAGTVLLVAVAAAVVGLLAVLIALVPRTVDDMTGHGGPVRRALGSVSRVIGFREPAGVAAPLEGGPDLVPLTSPWPVITAAALVLIGLGFVFGSWLLVPGVVLLIAGGIGWLTQLDRR
jgi:hypothetical protein